jgi:hypothetical protein
MATAGRHVPLLSARSQPYFSDFYSNAAYSCNLKMETAGSSDVLVSIYQTIRRSYWFTLTHTPCLACFTRRGLFLHHEDGSTKFLPNVCTYLPNYTASHRLKQ